MSRQNLGKNPEKIHTGVLDAGRTDMLGEK